MDSWDEPAADRAVAVLARTAGANAVYERLFRFGMRDFRDIGHKAIYVANSLRTLQSIGWQHAEPVLRSLAYALLAHEGDNPQNAMTRPIVPIAAISIWPKKSAPIGPAARPTLRPRPSYSRRSAPARTMTPAT